MTANTDFGWGLFPKSLGDLERINVQSLPPSQFVSGLMQLPVTSAAKRDSKLITDFQADRARLSKSNMMGISRLPFTDEARLRRNELQMRLVTRPLRFGNGELTLVDAIRNAIRVSRNKGRG